MSHLSLGYVLRRSLVVAVTYYAKLKWPDCHCICARLQDHPLVPNILKDAECGCNDSDLQCHAPDLTLTS
jgi:hypothetical protein